MDALTHLNTSRNLMALSAELFDRGQYVVANLTTQQLQAHIVLGTTYAQMLIQAAARGLGRSAP